MPLITVSGTQGIGKSTFIEDFLIQYPMFKTPERTYRDVIKEKGLKINKETTKYSQGLILDSIIEVMNSYSKSDDIIFDRCPLDNLVYSLWAYEKGIGDMDDDFVTECIQKSRLAMQKIDLILLIPITTQNIEIIEGENREIDAVYQKEINEVFQGLKRLRDKGTDDTFFVKDDCSPIIEIYGSRQDRINMTKLYLKENGSFYGDEDNMLLDARGDVIGGEDDSVDNVDRDKLISMLNIGTKDKK
jgi:predicted ATPase